MNLPATLHIMNGTSRRGWRCSSRLVLAVLVAVTWMGFAVSAFAADSGGTVTHNPKQAPANGGKVKSVDLKLKSVSAKLTQDGSQIEFTYHVTAEQGGDKTVLDDTSLDKAVIKIECKTKAKETKTIDLKSDKVDADKKETFNRKDLPGCKFKVSIETNLWGSPKHTEPKETEISDSKAGKQNDKNGCISVTFGLGNIQHGSSGGLLKIQSNWPSAELYSPKGISVSLDSQHVTPDANGWFQRAVTDDAVTTITDVVENQGYTIRFATPNGQNSSTSRSRIRCDNDRQYSGSTSFPGRALERESVQIRNPYSE